MWSCFLREFIIERTPLYTWLDISLSNIMTFMATELTMFKDLIFLALTFLECTTYMNPHSICFLLASYVDIVNSKLGMPRPQIGQSISQQGFFSSRDSLSVPCVSQPLHSYSATTSDMDLSRKNDSKNGSKLKPGEQPLLGSWHPSAVVPQESLAHPSVTSASTNHLTSNNGNGVNNNNADRWVTSVTTNLKIEELKFNSFNFQTNPSLRLCCDNA